MPPSGSRKKRAGRRKKTLQNSPTNPNPNSDPLPPLPLLDHQGDGNSSATEEEGEDETFETPKCHPDTPIAGGFGNRSRSNRMRSNLFPATAEGSTEKFYSAIAADDDDNNASKSSIQEVDSDSDENNGSNEMSEENHVIADEGSFVVADNPEDHLVGSEVIGEEVKLDESFKETLVPVERSLTFDEEPVEFHEAQTGNLEIPLLEPVDSSVSLGKEVKTVSWRDEGPPSVDFEATPRRCDEGFRDMVLEDSVTEPHEGRVKKLEGLKETNLDEFAFITEEVRKGSNGKMENVTGGRGKELISVDEALEEIRLEKLANEICTSVENSTLVTEEVNRSSNATAKNLDRSLAGVTLPEERKVREPLQSVEVKGVPTPDAAERTENSPRIEVARGPLVVSRASLWNCCGLLEVVTGSER